MSARITVSVPEMIAFAGSLDALTVLVSETLQVREINASSYGINVRLTTGEWAMIHTNGRIESSSNRVSAATKKALEQLSELLVVQIAAAKIRETARVRSETYLEGGAMVLSVEI